MDFGRIDQALIDAGHDTDLCAAGWYYNPSDGAVACMCGGIVDLPAEETRTA
jgi:hypothetical protein